MAAHGGRGRALLSRSRPRPDQGGGPCLRGGTDLSCFGGRSAVLGGILLCFALVACTPTVQVQAPKEPITINLNVKLDAEVRVKIEEQADKDIEENPDIF
jgi:hypothetical protein